MNETAVAGNFSMSSLVVMFIFGVAMLWFGGYLVSAVTYALFEKCKVHEATQESARAIIFSILCAFVPVAAVVSGNNDMAVGALAGQGMVAIGVMVGAFAIAKNLPVDAGLRMKELPILLAAVIIFALLSRGGMSLDRTDGWLLLVLGVVCAMFFMLKNKTAPENRIPEEKRAGFIVSYFKSGGNINVLRAAFMAAIAIMILAVGSAFVVDALGKFCAHYEIPALGIGATIAAFCGIIPVVSSAHGSGVLSSPRLVPGHIAGVCIFSIFICGGLAAEVSPLAISAAFFRVEIPGLFVLAALFWLFIRARETIGKFEGAIMFVTFAAFVWACVRGSL